MMGMVPIRIKPQVIKKYVSGIRVIELERLYERCTSTICTIPRQMDSIESIVQTPTPS